MFLFFPSLAQYNPSRLKWSRQDLAQKPQQTASKSLLTRIRCACFPLRKVLHCIMTSLGLKLFILFHILLGDLRNLITFSSGECVHCVHHPPLTLPNNLARMKQQETANAGPPHGTHVCGIHLHSHSTVLVPGGRIFQKADMMERCCSQYCLCAK